MHTFYTKILATLPGKPPLVEARAVRGGCIHEATQLHTQQRDYFLKWNADPAATAIFESEAHGLQHLQAAGLYTPEIIAHGCLEAKPYLLLSYVPPQAPAARYWETLGEQLAALHQHSAPHFGLPQDNFIGTLPQTNTPNKHWVSFLIERRLRPLATSPPLPAALAEAMQRLYVRLPSLLPEEPPALLHGDLWAGNLHVGARGMPCWIDPAVYYGAREMDMALPLLFGGFEKSFFDAYQSAYPFLADWETRVELYTLYPLLVHIHLFGDQYLAGFEQRLHRFV